MKHARRLALVLLVVVLATALDLLMREDLPVLDEPVREKVRLDPDLELLRERFNHAADRPRLLAVLSPGCPVCYAGSRAIVEELLDRRAGVEVLVVWSEVLPFDVRNKVGRRIDIFSSREAAWSFYDPELVAARRIAGLLGWPEGEVAWDVYLFYSPGMRWEDAGLPLPERWYHQHHDIADDRYRTGASLRRALRSAAEDLATPARRAAGP